MGRRPPLPFVSSEVETPISAKQDRGASRLRSMRTGKDARNHLLPHPMEPPFGPQIPLHHRRDHPPRPRPRGRLPADRKSVVSGKRVSVRVEFGGRRVNKKKKT